MDSGAFLGSIEWGYQIAGANAQLTLKPLVAAGGQPSAAHVAAFTAWNAQAEGPAAQRNAPAQVRIAGV